MGVQVVLNQINLCSLRKVDVGQLFENMSIVDSGASGPNGDMAPALMWSEYHEQAGDAVAFVFIVRPRGLTRSHRDWARVSLVNCLEVSSKQTNGRAGSYGRVWGLLRLSAK